MMHFIFLWFILAAISPVAKEVEHTVMSLWVLATSNPWIQRVLKVN